MGEEVKLVISDYLKKLVDEKVLTDDMWYRQQEQYYSQRDRRGRGLLILGPTRSWAMELAAISGIHPGERYVRVAAYDDPGALLGLRPAGILMAVPDSFSLHPRIRDMLLPMFHELARFQR